MKKNVQSVRDSLMNKLEHLNLIKLTPERTLVNDCIMIKINGTSFKCLECGANVFSKFSDGSYDCHGCEPRYSGE